MGTSDSHWLLLLFLVVSCLLVAPTHAKKKQTQVLRELYKAKLLNSDSYSTDTNHFKAVEDLEETHRVVTGQEGLKERDRIQELPGQPRDVGFNQYGGYVTVNEKAGRALYYYFAEAHRSKNKHSLPLLLWLNGGPGCSSLGFGALQEIGPFRVYSDGKTLYENKYAWNHAANVLFLESPAGVGFSYSNTSADYARGDDKKTASDNYAFLLNWLERFPEYKNRDFYISGESYAGHFVPQLAQTIDYHNKKANKTIVTLKGIIIGNAVIDDESGERGMYDYLASHALISDETWTQIHKYCNFSKHAYAQSDKCSAASDEVGKSIDDIDVYNIYAPLCPYSADYLVTSKPKMASVLNFDPCSDDYVHAYLNRPVVQRALHANVTKLHFEWESCSEVIERWVDSPATMIPVLQELLANGLRIWVFSGDTDGVVPVTSTKYAINKMKLPVKTAWRPWYCNGQVGGYTEVYEGGLTFATVRGAGHQVPSYQPARALSLITAFLSGTPLPNTTSPMLGQTTT